METNQKEFPRSAFHRWRQTKYVCNICLIKIDYNLRCRCNYIWEITPVIQRQPTPLRKTIAGESMDANAPQGTICHGSSCPQTGTCTLFMGIDLICVGLQLAFVSGVKCITETSQYEIYPGFVTYTYDKNGGKSGVGINLSIVIVGACYSQLDNIIITDTQNACSYENYIICANIQSKSCLL